MQPWRNHTPRALREKRQAECGGSGRGRRLTPHAGEGGSESSREKQRTVGGRPSLLRFHRGGSATLRQCALSTSHQVFLNNSLLHKLHLRFPKNSRALASSAWSKSVRFGLPSMMSSYTVSFLDFLCNPVYTWLVLVCMVRLSRAVQFYSNCGLDGSGKRKAGDTLCKTLHTQRKASWRVKNILGAKKDSGRDCARISCRIGQPDPGADGHPRTGTLGAANTVSSTSDPSESHTLEG